MSLDQTAYWQDIRSVEATLSNPCFIVNMKNKDNISETTPYHASIFIKDKTHRLATSEEIESYLGKEDVKRKAIAESRKPIQPQVNNNITISPDMVKAMIADAQKVSEEPKTTTAKKSK